MQSEEQTESSSGDGLERREFMKSALAIGGASALSTAVGLYGMPETAAAEPISVADRSNRQHAWAAFLPADSRGLTRPPHHRTLLFLDYNGSGEPSGADREEMEAALHQLEEAFEWSHEGLLFTVSYSPSYFDRFDDDLPTGIDLRDNRSSIEGMAARNEDPGEIVAEPYDAVLDLASDNVPNILAAEEALWGEKDEVNGVSIDHDLTGIFDRPREYPDRRTGFVGGGLPAENIDDEDAEYDIHDDAPLSMGFQSVYEDNIPSETNVTLLHDQTLDGAMPPGVFAQGSIAHVSKLDLHLDEWYEQSKDERVKQMYSPHHSEEDVGEVGNATTTSGTEEMSMRDADAETDIARETQRDAETNGAVGHAQKTARSRFDIEDRQSDHLGDGDLDTPILRRDVNTTNQDEPGLHFVSLQRFNGYMIYTRMAMNGVEFDASAVIPPSPDGDGKGPGRSIDHGHVDIDIDNDGFLEFVRTQRRGNFLMPPLDVRSLPPAQAFQPPLQVKPERIQDDQGVVSVTIRGVDGLEPSAVDIETLRFGRPEVVTRGGGATPKHATQTGNNDLVVQFPVDGTGFTEETSEARLFGKTEETRLPLFNTVDVTVADKDESENKDQESGSEEEGNEAVPSRGNQ